MFYKRSSLANFEKCTGKHLRQSLFFTKDIKIFIEKDTLAHVFYRVFCEIFKNIFFVEHLWVAAANRETDWLLISIC